jgi:hypothetical protein
MDKPQSVTIKAVDRGLAEPNRLIRLNVLLHKFRKAHAWIAVYPADLAHLTS